MWPGISFWSFVKTCGFIPLQSVSLMILRDEYPNVGIVCPAFMTLSRPSKGNVLLEVLDGQSAEQALDRTIRTETNKGVCFMFDPLQLERNYATIEKSVRSTIEGLLQLEDMLTYKKFVWCVSIAILEILLSEASWDDCLYRLLPYLRMRFLYKAIAFIGKQGATDC
ncbi:hypothetical protein GQ600_3487 [Phytophthora cactorum]|nr:hypothetical protein GQ600_3487 [Phytophthora cactorum]